MAKARIIKDLGNRAVHESRPVPLASAVTALRELFHVAYWLAHSYARVAKPDATLAFSADALPRITAVPVQTLKQLQDTATRYAEAVKAQEAAEALRLASEGDRVRIEAELTVLRAEIAKAKAENAKLPDAHDYDEATTRDNFIDLLLSEAGWALDKPEDREFCVTGMPNTQGEGFVDYVLWGDDGKPLGIVEAKRTKRDARVGQQQAKLYADCLEAQFGQRPVIFYTNGYEHWIWDDRRYPPRAIQGFLTKDELELAIRRRATLKPLAAADVDPAIVERFYQTRAIRRVTEAFEKDNLRRSLLVMATGAGKTRTVIALSDLLMRANWARRVLFLADRVALVNQAVAAFKRFLPAASPVNLVTDRNAQGRVYISTYPTMIGLIDAAREKGGGGKRRFGPGHFDLVVIDEAHRSVYRKYGAIFDYFDSLLVGLTATPKDEVDRDTYRLFDLQRGVPTDAYGLDEAVKDGFLVPPRAVSVPLKFQREGIKYDDLPEDEKEAWDAVEWDEDGTVPDRVDATALNKWLFNADTVDKVLEHLMTHGIKVAAGDRLGKTIIFAKNHDHAQFIAARFDANYKHFKGAFARVIDFKTEYAQSLIDDFSVADRAPHIAISVDMLDTGIDVPEVVRGVSVGTDMDRFRLKARHFLKANENQIAVLKLRRNEPLTPTDLAELERLFLDAGIAGPAELDRVRTDGGLGIFVRSIVGLDREAAKGAFDAFQAGKPLTSDQIEFVDMVIDHLTERGVMEPRRLYESPFTDLDPLGIAGVFEAPDVAKVIDILAEVRRRAAA